MKNDQHNSLSDGVSLVWLFVGLILLYLLPLGLIYLDEAVFKTFWFIKTFPEWAIEIVRYMYFFIFYLR